MRAVAPAARLRAGGVLAILLAWLVYTRLYFWLHPRGLTFAPSLFMQVTRHPDPTCGLTRTFAWMWQADVGQAILAYPLGPLLFALSWLAVAYLGWIIVVGRRLDVVVSRRTLQTTLLVSASLVAINWTAKLLWLGI